MEFSTVVRRILADEASYAYELNERAKRDAFPGTIYLAEVDMDLPMPQVAMAALCSGVSGYTSPEGTSDLRSAIAAWESNRTGVTILPEQIVCFPGAQSALVNSLRLLVEDGTPVLVANPRYATFPGSIALAGGLVCDVGRRESGSLDLSGATGFVESHRGRVRPVLLICSPDNPTGYVTTQEDLIDIAQFCCHYDVNLIADAIYSETGDFYHPLAIPELSERTIFIDGLSKWGAMPGVRVGWTVSSISAARALASLAELSHISISPAAQSAAAAVLSDRGAPEIALYKREFIERRSLMLGALSSPHISIIPPRGGMFLLVRTRLLCGSEYFCESLYEHEGVVVVPGFGFGLNDCSFRISLTSPRAALVDAARRIVRHCSRITGA